MQNNESYMTQLVGTRIDIKCEFMNYVKGTDKKSMYAMFCDVKTMEGVRLVGCTLQKIEGELSCTELHAEDKITMNVEVVASKELGKVYYNIREPKMVEVTSRKTHEVMIVKKWKKGNYLYFKFITNNGPKWLKINKSNLKIHRVVIETDGEEFIEYNLDRGQDDEKYENFILKQDIKRVAKYLLDNSKKMRQAIA